MSNKERSFVSGGAEFRFRFSRITLGFIEDEAAEPLPDGTNPLEYYVQTAFVLDGEPRWHTPVRISREDWSTLLNYYSSGKYTRYDSLDTDE